MSCHASAPGRPRKKKWFEFKDGDGQRWRVWLVLGPLKVDGVLHDGVTYRDKRTIYLSTRQSEEELVSTVIHEFIHAACPGRVRPENFGLVEEGLEMADYAAEERIARLSEKGLSAIFASLGFQFPPLPDDVVLKPAKAAQ